EDDMARRDFTVNAIARRLDTGDLVDPFGGAGDLERGVLRTVGPRSFAEDPLRIVRGLRLVSQLGLTPDDATLQQMRDEAGSAPPTATTPNAAHVSPTRRSGACAIRRGCARM